MKTRRESVGRRYAFNEVDRTIVNALDEYKVLRGSYLKTLVNRPEKYVKTRLRWLKDQGYIGNVRCRPETKQYPNLTKMNDPLYYLKRRAVEELLNQEFVKEHKPENEEEFDKCLMVSTVLKETPNIPWMHSATLKRKKDLPSFVPMILGTEELALAYYQKENLDYRQKLAYGYEVAMAGNHFKYYGILCRNRISRRNLAKWWHNHLKGKSACFFTVDDLSTVEAKLNGGYEELIKLNAENMGKVGTLTKTGETSLGLLCANEQGKTYTIVDLTAWDVHKVRALATVKHECFVGVKTNRELNDLLMVYPPLKKSAFNRVPLVVIFLEEGGVRVI